MPVSPVLTFKVDRIDPIQDDDKVSLESVNLAVGTYAKGSILGQVTATGAFAPYVAANVDGSQTARGILAYSCVVTAPKAGDTTGINDISYGNEYGITYKVTPMFYRITVATADLVQSGPGAIDAGAVTALGGLLFKGTLANGKLCLG